MIIPLKEKYQKEVIPVMMKKFDYKSPMAVPRIEKVVINTSFGSLIQGKTTDEQKKIYQAIVDELSRIAGQKAVLTKAKKSISTFKLRKGMPIGAKVTLRRQKMYDFLDRLIHIALPRTRDFKGLNQSSFDPSGNLTIPIKEHIVFPEISPEETRRIFGFEITIVTNARTKEEGIELLKLLGFPIRFK